MTNDALPRRLFLRSAGTLAASSWLRLLAPSAAVIAQAACTANSDNAPFTVLRSEEAADFAAVASRIIPSTDTPGATEAGVIHFFDLAFANEMSGALEFARTELGKINHAIAGGRFSDLDNDSQDALLHSIDGQAFFELMRLMTVYGFFAMSKYGGNKDHVGWDLIGFEGHQGAWQYPFGYYDARIHGEPVDDD